MWCLDQLYPCFSGTQFYCSSRQLRIANNDLYKVALTAHVIIVIAIFIIHSSWVQLFLFFKANLQTATRRIHFRSSYSTLCLLLSYNNKYQLKSYWFWTNGMSYVICNLFLIHKHPHFKATPQEKSIAVNHRISVYSSRYVHVTWPWPQIERAEYLMWHELRCSDETSFRSNDTIQSKRNW